MRPLSLRTCRCDVRIAGAARQFHSSIAHPANNAPPRGRSERSQDSFREISRLGSSVTSQRSAEPRARPLSRPPYNPGAGSGFARQQTATAGNGRQGGRSFQPRSSNPAGSRGRGSDNPRGRGAGRGRGGARGQPQIARRQRGSSDAVDEDDENGVPTNYDIMLEETGDNYASTDELRSYAQVVDLIDQYREHQDDLDAVLRNPASRHFEMPTFDGSDSAIQREFTPRELEELVEERRAQYDPVIQEAMDHVIEVDEMWLPRHEPGESWDSPTPPGGLGDVPIGAGGMTNVVEDNLRYLAQREHDAWEDPHRLADKLMAGEFVKFRNVPEREQILTLAEHKAYTPGQRTGWGSPNVGFEPPSREAKTALVSRMVSGEYADPNDAQLKGKTAINVARLINGNATFSAASKDKFLSKFRELMPEQFGAQGKITN